MLLDNILSGLGSSRSGSGSTHRGGLSPTVKELPSVFVNSNARHQTGSYGSDGTKTYSNSDGENYSIDAEGNVTKWTTPTSDTPAGDGAPTTTAEDDDNMLIWLLLPFAAMLGVKLIKNKQNNRKKKRR